MRGGARMMLLSGTLANLLPGPPALDEGERAAFVPGVAAEVRYTSAPRVAFPVVPVQVWGLRYDLDLVIESQHPDWNMHEYARVDLPGRPLWLAKDADWGMVQRIVADVPDIEAWVPEVPVERFSRPVEVEDRSTPGLTDVHLRYTNPKGQAVDLRYVGKTPTKPSPKRNGNTMGHSRDAVAALLDLHLFRPGGKVELSIDGTSWGVRRLFGLYPMKFALAQTQGGLAIADFRQSPAAGGFTLDRPGGEVPWPTRAHEAWTTVDGWARRADPVVSLSYHFRDGELDLAQAWQAGVEVPVTNVVFTPALPDVRRRFEGSVSSRFAVDIAGQPGHGTGVVTTRWTGPDEVLLQVRPTAPAWFASRPLDVTVHYDADGSVRVRAVRVQGAAPPAG